MVMLCCPVEHSCLASGGCQEILQIRGNVRRLLSEDVGSHRGLGLPMRRSRSMINVILGID